MFFSFECSFSRQMRLYDAAQPSLFIIIIVNLSTAQKGSSQNIQTIDWLIKTQISDIIQN